MRTLEWLMVVLSIPAIAWTLFVRRPWPLWVRLITILAVLLLPLHAYVEGAHWQMVPIYLAILLLLALIPLQRKPRWPSILLGSFITLLMLAGLAICYTLPMFHLPKPTGPYPIGTRTLYFIDPARQEMHPHTPPGNREVDVQLWYPSATASGKHAVYRQLKECDPRSTYQAVLKVAALQDAPFAAGKFPVILFNPAWRGFKNRSTFIMQELASHGFVVIGIGHPYNASIVELHDGRVADGRDQVDLGDFASKPFMNTQQRLDLANSEIRIQTDDDKFLLNQLEILNKSAESPFYEHLDLTHVGSFGHSIGGSVSAELASEDPRVLSAIILDGVLDGPVAETGLPKPLFRIKANLQSLPPGSENSPDPAIRVRAQMGKLGEAALANTFQKFGGYNVVIDGIGHENFDDKGFFTPFSRMSGVGPLAMPRAATIINTYILGFFEQTLKNQPQSIFSGQKQPFPEVIKFQSWPTPLTNPATTSQPEPKP
jgi:predicted dienelactone hydrolase